jgi:hypothetical protein
MFAVCLGVYQFYFKAKLVKYAEDKALLEALSKTYAGLNSTFKDEDPDSVIQQHSAVVENWKDAISARIPYFDDSEWREFEKPPEDVFILQFWYGEQTAKMTKELWEKAQKKYAAQVYQAIPMDVQSMLGVAYAEQWQGYDITPKLVSDQLERLKYGISLFELLMDGNAKYIRQVSLYEPQPSGFIGDKVEYSRAGLVFGMEMEDLVKFLEKLRMSDKYHSIEGIKVSHPYIMMKYEPIMEVELFLLRTRSKPEVETASTGAVAGAAGGSGLASPNAAPAGLAQPGVAAATEVDDDGWGSRRRTPAEPPSGFGKFWKWFKRTVLFTN